MKSGASCVAEQDGHLLCKVCRCTVGSESDNNIPLSYDHYFLHTLLTPRSRVILEKPTGSQPFN